MTTFTNLLFIILFFTAGYAIAQQQNEHCKWIKLVSSPIVLDSLSVVPGSIKAQNPADSIFLDSFDFNQNLLFLNQDGIKDSVLICFKTYPYNFRNVFYKRSLNLYDSNALFKNRPNFERDILFKKEEIFATEGIQKTGSIARGISFGNTQNLFVNSALNLQMEGALSENLNIRAVISDQNIPYQPEGNTQRLQEFDRVFIQVFNDKISINAGDIVLQNKQSHFLRYYKNVQGGQLQTNYKTGVASEATSSLSASVAKGKFASVQVEALEGISGPYRLRGPDNERFVIVISNSEKIFLDGKLLQRGWDYDYTIDYNLGEITFTNKVIITKFSRIRADFEYSDRNYSRTVVAADHFQKIGKFEVYSNYYQEKDNPNQPLIYPLSDQDKLLLSQVGDDLQQAIIPSFDSVGFSKNQVLYSKKDTLVDDKTYTVFYFSSDPEKAFYQVSFHQVGVGKGNYRQKNSTVNGRVYEWVSPVNGQPQGDFEPVRLVPTPNKKQMIVLGGSANISEYEKVYTELAFSDHDLNLYSDLDSDDNKGHATKVGFISQGRGIGNYKFRGTVDYEFNDRHFNAIDRFRYIEFDRDWSYDPNLTPSIDNDHILSLSTSLEKDLNNSFSYKIIKRNRGNFIDGHQHYIDLAKKIGKIELRSDLFLLDNEQAEERSRWTRHNTTALYRSKYIVPGYTFSMDKNKVTALWGDSIIRSAMNFQEHRFFLRSNDSLKTQYEINYSFREDYLPAMGELVKGNAAHTANFSISKMKESYNFSFLLTYRNLENFYSEYRNNEETIMGRADWGVLLFDRHIRSDVSYAVSNGRELKREFMFLQVPTGEGTHTWRDDNGDGIQDLNEFYEAVNPDERNFVKIFVPTDEYILAYTNNWNYRLNAEMPKAWRNDQGFKKVLSKFSNNTAWTIDNKTTNERLWTRLAPFSRDDDHLLLSTSNLFRSTFFFNRSSPKFGMDAHLIHSQRKLLLVNGFEEKANKEYQYNARYNIKRTYNLRLLTSHGLRSNVSDFLAGRDYTISSLKIIPELSWQPSLNFRLTGSFVYTDKFNIESRAEAPESAKLKEYNFDLRLSKVVQSTFNATLRYIHIDFVGEEHTPIGYDLLQALRPGNNFTLSLNWQQKLISGLLLNFNYEGRKSENTNLIHIGKMQVTALF